MDVRNVQKTGNMFYLYLPTSWCRKNGIDSSSKVSVSTNSDGTLSVHPEIKSKLAKSIHLKLAENDQEILNKVIVSCYINPASSFKITLNEEMDSARLLDRKKLLNVELVEFDGKTITCESPVRAGEPAPLLKTMIVKVKNLVSIMLSHYDKELIERYEEEIDRSKLLIEKATISLLTFQESSTLKAVEIHYIDLLAKSLERLTDHLRLVEEGQKKFLESLLPIIEALKRIIEKNVEDSRQLDFHEITDVVKMAKSISKPSKFTMQTHHQLIILSSLEQILEVLMDWSLTIELDKTS